MHCFVQGRPPELVADLDEILDIESPAAQQRIIYPCGTWDHLAVGIFLGIALITVGAIFIVSREQMKRGLQKQPAHAPEPAADRALAAPGRWMVASRLRTGLVGGLFMAFGLFLIVVVPT